MSRIREERGIDMRENLFGGPRKIVAEKTPQLFFSLSLFLSVSETSFGNFYTHNFHFSSIAEPHRCLPSMFCSSEM
jgi:hypothetical protein